MTFSLYNFVAGERDEALQAELADQGYAIRRLDGSDLHDAADLWAASARQLGHASVKGWDPYLDVLGGALLPDDDEPDRVALLWSHADHLARADLGAFCAAFDALTTIARAAYAQGTTVLLFFLGDGLGRS